MDMALVGKKRIPAMADAHQHHPQHIEHRDDEGRYAGDQQHVEERRHLTIDIEKQRDDKIADDETKGHAARIAHKDLAAMAKDIEIEECAHSPKGGSSYQKTKHVVNEGMTHHEEDKRNDADARSQTIDTIDKIDGVDDIDN